MNREIVVAKYEEDVSWLNHTCWPTTIYEKSPGPRMDLDRVRYVELPNPIQGREAHTYLHHVVHRYNRLADVTYFLQGFPFHHFPDMYRALSPKYHFRDVVGFSWYHGNEVCPYDSWFETRHDDLELSMGTRVVNAWMDWRWDIAFPGEYRPPVAVFSSGAQLAVPRWRILQRPRSFYERLLDDTQKEPCVLDAWLFEIIWLYVFGGTEPKRYAPRSNGKMNPLCFS